EELVATTCAAARLTAEDTYAGLPDASLFGDAACGELDLYDEAIETLDVETARTRACEAEATAMEADDRITNSEGGEMSWGIREVHLANSLGVYQNRNGSSASLWTTPVAGDGHGMQRDYWYTSARHAADLATPQAVGAEAARRTLRRLDARKPETCQVPVVFESTVASRLLGALSGAINGGSIYRKASYLCDSLGETIAAPNVTIVDNPHLVRGPASKPFDGEGLPTTPLTLVDRGVLQSYVLDSYTARKLDMTSTRHASRGLGGTPSPSTTNLWMDQGDQSLDELIAGVSNGLLVTELFGFGVNTITGDYSQGAVGIWIEDGKLTHAVNEFTIASTLPKIWKGIDGLGNDRDPRRATSAPSMRIQQMTVAGS
ncbi:MAG: metallopeptidase TldD-related protein, partial [Myxococcota bacterium]|nr:metallopeptidase TldD-related protein [Myxococcota bacterium]